MITINGFNFMEKGNPNERGGAGQYKIIETNILFYSVEGELFACLSKNKWNEYMFLSAKHYDNKIWYGYAMTSTLANLGLETVSYNQIAELAEQIYNSIFTCTI